ncbi:MAG: 3'-5' exonuclease [Chloroflexota bacterium]|nr:3'-5' exonuclease [Chloroflexota bacterium]
MTPQPKEIVRRDKIIVVDIEATCWIDEPPPGQDFEIIEVGVSVFDMKTRTPSPPVSILVKPTISTVSEFCTSLTTLTQALVDTGVTFAAACARLQAEFDTKQFMWASWGNYDYEMFKSQCHRFGVEYPFSGRHMNFKTMFAQAYNNKARVGMAEALNKAGLTIEGTHHRGGDDAYNIARILGVVLEKHGDDVLLKYW